MLTSSWDVFEMPHQALLRLLQGCMESRDPHGTVPAGCRDDTIRSRWTESPEPTRSHQSFWHEEQVILRESCFGRLLNCSWHCFGRASIR